MNSPCCWSFHLNAIRCQKAARTLCCSDHWRVRVNLGKHHMSLSVCAASPDVVLLNMLHSTVTADYKEGRKWETHEKSDFAHFILEQQDWRHAVVFLKVSGDLPSSRADHLQTPWCAVYTISPISCIPSLTYYGLITILRYECKQSKTHLTVSELSMMSYL